MKILCVPVGPLQANCYLVSDDRGVTCAIDPGGEPERLAGILNERGLQLTHVLLTHGHIDHLGGAAELARLTGALVGCADATAVLLRDPLSFMPFPGFGEVPGRDPDLILEEGDVVEVGDLSIDVIETPGHSPGCLTYEVGGTLFVGDLLFYRSIGRTDFPGGDFDTLVASVQKLVNRYPPSTQVLPGHMEPTTLGDEARENPFLRGLSPRG
ncbi:MAG: MBL fold metallo-hydrolase [Thermoleophilia bacterium]|nr:MBL fold metallo-hydrolase [Thermoleophilia bacterium]